MSETKTVRISEPVVYDGCIKYVKQYPRIFVDGIYEPCHEYVMEGCQSTYRLVMSKEMFIEAYNKWIKGEEK